MGRSKLRVRALHFLQQRDALSRLPGSDQHEALAGKDGMRRRIEFLSLAYLLQAFAVPPRQRKGIGIPRTGQRVRRVQFDGAAELLFALHKIPVAIGYGKGRGAMRFGEGIVQLDGPAGSGNGARAGPVLWHGGMFPQQVVCVRQADIHMGVARIVDNRLCEVIQGANQAVRGSLTPLVSTLEVEAVSRALLRI